MLMISFAIVMRPDQKKKLHHRESRKKFSVLLTLIANWDRGSSRYRSGHEKTSINMIISVDGHEDGYKATHHHQTL